jgi:hypothetical protein
MGSVNTTSFSEQALTGRWVAVDPRGLVGFQTLADGTALVDYDADLDVLCRRVADAGLKRLTIRRYEPAAQPVA